MSLVDRDCRLADRISEIGYPSGRSVRYSYDSKGRVAGVETRGSAAGAWVTLASNMTYQPFGSIESVALGNGLVAANDRGQEGWLKRRSLTNVASTATPIGTKLSDLIYGYDPDGNVTTIDDAVTPARSSLYGYDAMGRLTTMVAEGNAANADYSYTSGTNRLEQMTTQAATRSIVYDARGNPSAEARAGAQSVSLGYDGYGRLTSYARSSEVDLAHSYNGMDDRVSTTTSLPGGSVDTSHFVYAPDGRVLGEYGSSASDVRAEFIWLSPEVAANDNSPFGGDDGLGGYMPLAVAATDAISGSTQLYWLHANHMGVPHIYTNASGAAVTPPAGYSAPGFPGQSRTLNDLYYNRYRDYDPTTGRYIQADPIGLAGGASPYSYAMNSPLRYTDPTGEFVPIVIAGGFLFGVGSEILIQAGSNWWNGRDVLNADCYDGREILLSGGMGALGGGLGALRTLRYAPKSLTRITGVEWSHFIPRRIVKLLPKGKLRTALNKRGGINGRWATPKQHYKHDPYRWPKDWDKMGERLHPLLQPFGRTPPWLRGIGGGTGLGIGAGEADGQ